MEVGSRRREAMRERSISPERTKVWVEPRPRTADRKVPVVYYLTRNGHLEHPHFMEVSIPLGEGLYLRDVIKRLNSLRGKGIASMYAWSSKRIYRNGFVWHDLSEDDFIYPAHGNEYILKGSELLHLDSDEPLRDVPSSASDDSGLSIQRRNRTSWGSFDLNEYKVYKSNKNTSDALVENNDAWTQTIKEEDEETNVTEVGREEIEISPPCSTSSSSETLEGLIKADGSIVPIDTTIDKRGKRTKSHAGLMQLISCGSISLVSHFKGRLPRVMSGDVVKTTEGVKESASLSPVKLEDKEYFSGSLIEIKKKAAMGGGELFDLRRSSSYNADRGLKMELAEKEIEGVKARCIPRKPKAKTTKKQENPTVISSCASESKSTSDESSQN